MPAVLPSDARIALDVEDVVDDLERQADLGGVARRSPRPTSSSAPAMIAPLTADARMSAPVLRACMARRPSASSVIACPRRLPGRLQIDRLSADHAAGARGFADDRGCTRSLPRARSPDRPSRGSAREQRERLGVQAVARQDRDAVAVDDVQRRPSAAQRVVVHRGQVVVDERVGVDQLDGAGGGQRRWDAGLARAAIE